MTGVRPAMDGDIMYMLIYREPDKELRYLEFDFNSAIAKSTLIAEDVEMKPFSIFYGGNSQV